MSVDLFPWVIYLTCAVMGCCCCCFQNDIHANIGGGRDNVIRYNVMYNALVESIQVDGRGLHGGHGAYLRGKLQVEISLCTLYCMMKLFFFFLFLTLCVALL